MWKVDNNENKNDEEDNSNWLVEICLRLAKLFWRRLYKHCHPYIYFPYSATIFLLIFVFWTNLSSLLSRMYFAKFKWNCMTMWFWRRIWKCDKLYNNNRQISINFHLGWAKKGKCIHMTVWNCLIKNNLSYYSSSIHYRLLIAKEFVYLWTENNWMDSTDCTNHYILCTCSLVTQKSTTIS